MRYMLDTNICIYRIIEEIEDIKDIKKSEGPIVRPLIFFTMIPDKQEAV